MYYLKQTEHKGEQKEVNINIDWLDKFDKQYKKFHKDDQKEARRTGAMEVGKNRTTAMLYTTVVKRV